MVAIKFCPVMPFAATISYPNLFVTSVTDSTPVRLGPAIVPTSILHLEDNQGSWQQRVYGNAKNIGDEITTAEERGMDELDLTFFSNIR